MNDDIHTFIEPEVQARITVLVLGEASEFERDELEKLIAEKPELEIYRRRMQAMHDLLGSAIKPEQDPAWQLSQERRDKLRQTFSKKPEPASWGNRRSRGTARTQVRAAAVIAACLLFTVILFFMASPLAMKSDETRATPEIISYQAAASKDMDFDDFVAKKEFAMVPEAPANELETREEAAAPQTRDLPVLGRMFRQKSNQPGKLQVKTGNVEGKPSAPSSRLAGVIASASTSPSAVPVPEPAVDFGNSDDLGNGWGSGNGRASGVLADADPFSSSDVPAFN